MGFQSLVHVFKDGVGQTAQAGDASWLMIQAVQHLMPVFPLHEWLQTIAYLCVLREATDARETACAPVLNAGQKAMRTVRLKKSACHVIKHRKTLKEYPQDSCLMAFEQPLTMV